MKVPQADERITSLANRRVKDLVRLRDRTHRDRAGLVLIEGYRELRRAVDAKISVDAVYFCEGYFLGSNEAKLLEDARQAGAALFELSKPPFAKISYRDRPDGLIATAPKIGHDISELKLGPNPLVIIAEAVEKPGNLGTILRTADAVGVDAVLVCDPATDINNPNVVRASTGTLFSIPIAETSLEKALIWIRENGLFLLAATPSASLDHTEVDLTRGSAIAVGAEQYGLSDKMMQAADYRVRIPMAGLADSLNVSAAATVLLFEAARQRGFGKSRND